MTKQYTKCDFCKYFSGKTCLARPNSQHCTEALNEYYAWLKNNKQQPTKSLRPWDRRR